MELPLGVSLSQRHTRGVGPTRDICAGTHPACVGSQIEMIEPWTTSLTVNRSRLRLSIRAI
jgi:hypothetical protein